MESSNLFAPLQLGRHTLSNRVTMAAMTRQRAGRSGVPTELHTQYHAQRASLGLIVTEGVFPSLDSRAFPGQAGITNDAQQAGWQHVAEAVHTADGVMFMQVMHGGRVCHPNLTEGADPVAPSAICSGTQIHTFDGKQDAVTPRELEVAELERIVGDFRAAARRAVDAGVDGIEIHNANGYLLHEFLAPSSNQRTDSYGGSVDNRLRFPLAVARAVAEEIGADRVGVRISPEHNVQGVIEDDRADVAEVYGRFVDELAELEVAYVSILHADPTYELVADLARRARGNGRTRVLMNNGFAQLTELPDAEAMQRLDYVDAVSVGREIIGNPDIVRRWKEGLALNTPEQVTFYADGAHGYTDYPFAD